MPKEISQALATKFQECHRCSPHPPSATSYKPIPSYLTPRPVIEPTSSIFFVFRDGKNPFLTAL
jgi:hypothetical protein